MLLWSYFYVLVTDPGGVPLNWRPEIDEEAGQGVPLVESEYSGAGLVSNQSVMAFDPANQKVRFCRKCNHFKPPRCHHCSVCKYFHISFSILKILIVVWKIPHLSVHWF